MICCSCSACLRINGVEQPHNQILHATIELSDRTQLVHDNLFAFFGGYHVLTINLLRRFNLRLGSSAGDTGIRNNGLGGRGLDERMTGHPTMQAWVQLWLLPWQKTWLVTIENDPSAMSSRVPPETSQQPSFALTNA